MKHRDKKQVQAQKTQSNYRVGRSSSGLGLFATVPFRKGDFVIEYTGEKIPTKEAKYIRTKYLFEISSRWTINGSDRKNLARYINHSCRPNCEVEFEGQRIMVYARKKILPGEEFSYDYGEEYFNEFIKPNGCRCPACQARKK